MNLDVPPLPYLIDIRVGEVREEGGGGEEGVQLQKSVLISEGYEKVGEGGGWYWDWDR